jgi:hypothetical protein
MAGGVMGSAYLEGSESPREREGDLLGLARGLVRGMLNVLGKERGALG